MDPNVAIFGAQTIEVLKRALNLAETEAYVGGDVRHDGPAAVAPSACMA
jgi:hypothetical protein